MTGAPAETEDALLLLATGELEVLGLLPRASNYTFLARVCASGAETLAVYKPRAGEMPLWDFPDGTLSPREVAAYEVARTLGWPSVPPTVLRDGPEGPGSVQQYVEHDPGQHYFTLRARRPDDFRRIALFDVAVNNADRKAGHLLLDHEERIFVVDHGVCFSPDPKLRTVIWDFAGEPIPDELVPDLRRLGGELRSGPLRHRLGGLLDRREVDAARARTEALLETGRFPHPGPGRPYPWPIV
jgi:uncharacterized repeat protein (TIGR03843 family)